MANQTAPSFTDCLLRPAVSLSRRTGQRSAVGGQSDLKLNDGAGCGAMQIGTKRARRGRSDIRQCRFAARV
jgi:hypothetical protein